MANIKKNYQKKKKKKKSMLDPSKYLFIASLT